jgi:hypothetical protein
VDPKSQDAHFNLGVAFAEANIYGEAIREWEAVIAIDSTTSVGQQAKQNATLLGDVLKETRYRGGKRSRAIDMRDAVRTTTTVSPADSTDDQSEEPDPEH